MRVSKYGKLLKVANPKQRTFTMLQNQCVLGSHKFAVIIFVKLTRTHPDSKTCAHVFVRVNMEKVAVHKYPLRVAPIWTASSGKDKTLEGRAHYEALDREATKECLAAYRAAQQGSTDKYGMR